MPRNPDIEMHREHDGDQPTYGRSGGGGPDDVWAMACHLSAFAGYLLPFGHIIGPLIVWLIKGKQSPQVDRHGKEALNFQISMTIYLLISAVLVFAVIGIFLLAILSIADFILIIVAAVKTRSGEYYRYPLTIRFIK